MPAHRLLVDEGSPLFNQAMKNVPILSPKLQAWVEPAVREESMRSMNGEAAQDEGGASADEEAASAEKPEAKKLEETEQRNNDADE